jgi:uncharacterized protein
MKNFDQEAFKAKLEAQTSFPSLYMFKFIVPTGKEHEVKALMPKHQIELKPSSKGNYISVTIKAMMPNSDAILDIYNKASVIEGVIAL